MTVYLVFTTILDHTSCVGVYATRELADQTVKMLTGVQFTGGKDYWVIEQPVVTQIYQTRIK